MGAQQVIDLLLLPLPLSCRASNTLPFFRFWPLQDSFTVSLGLHLVPLLFQPLLLLLFLLLHLLRHLINATTTRHPPWHLQAQDKHAALHAQLGRSNQHILPLTHTHSQSAKVCLCCICKCANQTCSPVNLSSRQRIKRAFSSRHFSTDIASIASLLFLLPTPTGVLQLRLGHMLTYMVAIQQKVLL